MSTLAEIEAAILRLSAEDLAALEKRIQTERLKGPASTGHSILDIPLASVGAVLPSAGSDDLLDEMLEDRM